MNPDETNVVIPNEDEVDWTTEAEGGEDLAGEDIGAATDIYVEDEETPKEGAE